jgi:hypothetical protein
MPIGDCAFVVGVLVHAVVLPVAPFGNYARPNEPLFRPNGVDDLLIVGFAAVVVPFPVGFATVPSQSIPPQIH